MLSARELMSENPVCVDPTTTVREAVSLLQSLDVRHLPVVEDGELVGMLSDRDLRALSVPAFIGGAHVGELLSALNARVSSLMNSDVLSVSTETDASEIIDLMIDNKVGAVAVTGEDGGLVGIVSYVDVLRNLPTED